MSDGMIELPFNFLFLENRKIFPIYKAFFSARRLWKAAVSPLQWLLQPPVPHRTPFRPQGSYALQVVTRRGRRMRWW